MKIGNAGIYQAVNAHLVAYILKRKMKNLQRKVKV
jgi:hypothetical protein